ncbi:MAG: hypothetical protein R3213_11790 [Flavobacteriaceae bacterium]|nr:hypothetical protein [Flavobacteriaceae bacterium]
MNLKKVLGFLTLLLFLSCEIPQDPRKSWENIEDTQFNVGVVIRENNEGVETSKIIEREKDLIKNFSNQHGLKLNMVEGSETYLVHKLESYELDAVIGGFKSKSVWGKYVGMTKPYDHRHVIFIPKGENKLLYKLESFILKHK